MNWEGGEKKSSWLIRTKYSIIFLHWLKKTMGISSQDKPLVGQNSKQGPTKYERGANHYAAMRQSNSVTAAAATQHQISKSKISGL
jgi:hypothetical protein